MKHTNLKVYFLIATFFLCNFILKSQDVLHFRDGNSQEVKIIKVTDSEVVYTYDDADDLKITTKTAKLNKVNFENGEEIEWHDPNTDILKIYEEDYHNNFKASVLDYAVGTINLYYEHALNYKNSYQIGFSIYNAFNNHNLDITSGFSCEMAYKFKIAKSYKVHTMNGTYLMPNIGAGTLNFKEGADIIQTKRNSLYIFGDLSVGMQHVFNNKFVLDYGVMLGLYNISNIDDESIEFARINPIHSLFDGLHSGVYLKIGHCFGKKTK